MPNVYAVNRTSYLISVNSWDIYYINNSNAELITVYDSNNNLYDCFKYVLNNTPWFYVLDSVQNSWVNDLSSIGYSLTPFVVLPTVSVTGDFGANNELYVYGGGMGLQVSISAGATKDATLNGTTKVTYDNGKSYGVVYWFTGTPGRTDIALINNNGNLAFKNITNQKFYTRDATVAVCSSNLGTVVTVYDSSNNAYNAFKFTASGTDYYYVLDGTQTDWTDDLSSIGYRLDMQFYFYFKSDVSTGNPIDVTFDYALDNNYWNLRVRNSTDEARLSSYDLLYTNPSFSRYGNLLADNSYAYELLGIYLPDDSDASFNLSDFYIFSGSTIIAVWCTGSYSTPVRSCLISIKPTS